jgi:hypothetical protein
MDTRRRKLIRIYLSLAIPAMTVILFIVGYIAAGIWIGLVIGGVGLIGSSIGGLLARSYVEDRF